jgi:uncharacterized protein (TIGR00251 family)
MPPTRSPRLHDARLGSALAVRVIPRAGKNQIAEIMNDGRVKIRLTAAPVDGEANQQLIRFLAEALHVSKSTIEIVAGQTGRDKLVAVHDLDPQSLQQRIAALVG